MGYKNYGIFKDIELNTLKKGEIPVKGLQGFYNLMDRCANVQFGLLTLVAKCFFSFTAFPHPVIVMTICLYDNFEKLCTLLGFSRDISEMVGQVTTL